MKLNSEWEDAKAYEDYVDAIGAECKENKTCMNWYAFHAQKPLNQKLNKFTAKSDNANNTSSMQKPQ